MANNRNVLNCTPLLFSLSVILVFGCLGMTEARSYRLQQNTEGQQEASYGTNSLLQSRQSFPERRQFAAGPALAVGAFVLLVGIATVAGVGFENQAREQRDKDAKTARISTAQTALATATAAVLPAQAKLNAAETALTTSQTTLATAQTALNTANTNLATAGTNPVTTMPTADVIQGLITTQVAARDVVKTAEGGVTTATATRDAEQVEVDKLNAKVTEARTALDKAEAS